MKPVPSLQRFERGLSLVEAIVTVTVIGILACAAMATYERFFESSKEAVAQNTVETLNGAVKKYVQLCSPALGRVPANSTSFAEELDVLRALQWDDPADHSPGAPYMRADYNPAGSLSASDYRAVWNGSFFELAVPGQAGGGLKIDFDGADLGRPVTFPDGYQPLAGY